MLKRHQDQLMSRLDELYTRGTTYISWNELYHWYNRERIAKKPWRDIKARWQELLVDEKDEEYTDPLVAQNVTGGIVLFFSNKPEKLKDLAA